MTARWLSPKQAAAHSGYGVDTVLASLKDGTLRGYQRVVAGRWRIAVEDVDAWVMGEPPAPRDVPAITRRSA